jgi:type IV pilus assembly protein PilE
MNTTKQLGFTLIELMITVAVIGILAAIALPSYSAYLRRSQRSDATSALLRLAAAQEKYYLQNNSYESDMTKLGSPTSGSLLSEHGWYSVSVAAPSGGTLITGFVATATPTSGSPQSNDKDCTSFTIDQSGFKDAFKGSASNKNACWR